MNFSAEGSWYELPDDQVRDAQRSKVWNAVRSMVSTRRRNPDLFPSDFAEMIHAAGVEKAFPNVRTWRNNWLTAGCTTAAERTVKTACGGIVPNPIGETISSEEVVALLAGMGLPAPHGPDLPVSDSVPTPATVRPSQGILERSDAWEILA